MFDAINLTILSVILYNHVMNKQLIADERFTNIQRAQAGLTKLFEEAEKSSVFYRVMKSDKPLGVLIPNALWEEWLEDQEIMLSDNLRDRVASSRKSERVSVAEIKKLLGL